MNETKTAKKQRNDRRSNAGICIHCKTDLPTGSRFKGCATCRKKHYDRQQELDRKRANGEFLGLDYREEKPPESYDLTGPYERYCKHVRGAE